ncbi:hypothetical protein RHMOL_Rhmol07G0204500 [Rhododendron molle]|uniref:Uncharacterized protein n=1 Tax=Rhododendron molle TaxID=49168 RepID=A0ACC0N309_RHOML|nr:hypothetical protein RHMOL_Rhmol07G0204500 [Rhododendron molle]
MASPENDKTNTTPTASPPSVSVQPKVLGQVALPDAVIASSSLSSVPSSSVVAVLLEVVQVFVHKATPLKAAPDIPGFNSPPPVFASPCLNTRGRNYLGRLQCPQLPTAELSQQGARAKKIDILSDEYHRLTT